MAKKEQIIKISPASCLQSLQAYHEAVMLLTITLKQVLPHFEDQGVSEWISKPIQEALDGITKFYN
jgi:hypothetical protein